MVKKEKRQLSCNLTTEEVSEYSKQLARITTSISEIKEEKKNITSEFNNKISTKEAMAKSLSHKISTESEFREVECEWTYDWRKNQKHLFRMDTHEEVEVEPIPEWEKQQSLDDVKENEEPAPGPAPEGELPEPELPEPEETIADPGESPEGISPGSTSDTVAEPEETIF